MYLQRSLGMVEGKDVRKVKLRRGEMNRGRGKKI